MIVKELIEKLEKLDQYVEIEMKCYEVDDDGIDTIWIDYIEEIRNVKNERIYIII